MSTPTEYARLSGALNGVKEQLQREHTAHQQLRAAIEALAEEWEAIDAEISPALGHPAQGSVLAFAEKVRDLLADDGAALRERDDRIRRDYAETIARRVERLPEGWPMEHHCFKPTCPDCRERKRIERERQRAGRVIRDIAGEAGNGGL